MTMPGLRIRSESYKVYYKPHASLQLRHDPTEFTANRIVFNYSHDDLQNNRRAYIDTLVGLLRCHMDFQCADGRDMLLQYVSSYVTKLKDHDVLYETIMRDVSGYDVANKYMGTMSINVPEMVGSFSDIGISSTGATTKKFFVPLPEQAATNSTVRQYCFRPADDVGLSLVEYLRKYRTSTAVATIYKRNTAVLVGVKVVSYFNVMYPFQHCLLYVPFTDLNHST